MEVRILEAQNEVYQKQKLLGQGAFGKAYLVRQKQTGQQLVIKEVSIDHMSQKEREETIKQAQILRNLKHPLIVRFVEVYATKQNKLKIVMEYAQCGDLSKAIATRRAQKKTFQQTQILDWFTQICLAMKHVHDRKILHRDIKGQNIFITKTNTLKLGDFGIARVLNKTQDKARTVVGTPYYLSPEIIENKPYSFKSDVWSMGVLLYELCALSPPFTANSLQFLALKIVKGSYTALTGSFSKQLKTLIGEMLHLDPNRRPNIQEILKKPFLQDRIRKYLSETYRKDEFSHTILHNQKVEISNKLVKVQEDKKIQNQRNKLKQEALLLKQKMEKKKDQQKSKEEQRLKRKRDEEFQKKEDLLRRRQYQQKAKDMEQKRALQQRKQWIEKQRRKQQQLDQRKRVQQIAEQGRRKQRDQQELLAKKERLLQQKYQLERNREIHQQEIKKKENKDKQKKKVQQFNELARKQWYQNQMIKKMAQERARQSQMEPYYEPPVKIEEPKITPQRPQSNKDSRNSSRQQKPNNNNYDPPKKLSVPQYQPSQEQLQNAYMNPNFNRKNPQSAKSKSKQSTNASNWNSKSREEETKHEDVNKKEQQRLKQDSKATVKKGYDQAREQIRKDRQEFLKNKQPQTHINNKKIETQTLKPAKWQKKSRQKSQESPKKQKQANSKPKESPQKFDQTMMESNQLRLNIKDQQQFQDYLNELENLLDVVNKNVQKMEPFPQFETVQQKIVLREDDCEELNFSITASFDALNPPKQHQVNDQNADLDYFSSYSKLEDLRICLEDKFGTQNFINIYRGIEEQLQTKGLEHFNILEVIKRLGNIPNSNLIANNLPLLLTLIVMEQKMSSV